MKRRYLDSTTSNLENWVLAFLKRVAVVPRLNAKSDGSIDAAYARILEALRPDAYDRTRVRRVLTARGKAVPHGAGDGLVCH